MNVRCPSFSVNGVISVRHAHGGVPHGGNISPAVSWGGAPPETRSFALSIVDQHPIARNWVHWAVVNIPADMGALPEGASGQKGSLPSETVELINSFGTVGYGGPKPPPGSGPHRYVITIYALSIARCSVAPGDPWGRAKDSIRPHVLASAQAEGTFEL